MTGIPEIMVSSILMFIGFLYGPILGNGGAWDFATTEKCIALLVVPPTWPYVSFASQRVRRAIVLVGLMKFQAGSGQFRYDVALGLRQKKGMSAVTTQGPEMLQ